MPATIVFGGEGVRGADVREKRGMFGHSSHHATNKHRHRQSHYHRQLGYLQHSHRRRLCHVNWEKLDYATLMAACRGGYRRSAHERSYPTSGPVSTGMAECLWAGIPSRYVTNQLCHSASHPSWVAKSSISFGWSKGGNVTSAEWQVTLCDPAWHLSSRSGEASVTATGTQVPCELPLPRTTTLTRGRTDRFVAGATCLQFPV